MEFINFVMALSPIVVVLVGILAFHQSAKKSRTGRAGLDTDSGFYVF